MLSNTLSNTLESYLFERYLSGRYKADKNIQYIHVAESRIILAAGAKYTRGGHYCTHPKLFKLMVITAF